MPFIHAGGLVVHFELTGPSGAPVLLFANSLGTNFHLWDHQVATFAPKFRVLRYDMRGHGLTDCPALPAEEIAYTLDQLADDVSDLLDALGIDQVHFCGLSIGGIVGQAFAIRSPNRTLSLMLCDTAARIATREIWEDRIATVRTSGLASIADGVLARWFTNGFIAKGSSDAGGFRNMLLRTPADGYVGCCCALRDADLRAQIGKITARTLVVVGAEDMATPLPGARELAEGIRGAQLVVIPEAAHISPVEQPDAFNDALDRFLEFTAGSAHGRRS